MKRVLFLLLLLCFYTASFALVYYSQAGQTDANNFTSWNINPLGGGAIPATFTNPGDRFIIQLGHSMVTTAIWTFGDIGSELEIEYLAVLQGDHAIQFTGTFQIDDGGTYIHNNNGSVAQPAGLSIFGGTESFAATSNFEIRNWQTGPVQGLPNTGSGITWGNLIINLTDDLGTTWSWNLGDGTNLIIAGNLDIRSTYVGGTVRELRLTGSGTQTINIGGDLLISGTSYLAMKENSGVLSGNTTVQVNGNITMSGTSTLYIGNTSTGSVVGTYDLRFKGNFTATASNTITAVSPDSYLVANGTALQTLTCPALLGCNFRVAPGAIVNQSGSMANGSGREFAILGTYNDNGFTNTFSGRLEVAGGTFYSTGALAMGANLCRTCTGNGTYVGISAAWCTATGSRGRINFSSGVSRAFSQSASSMLLIGSGASAGDLYMTNNATIGFTGVGSGTGLVNLAEGSILSIDGGSAITGNANYSAFGGTLRIGSIDGITATGNFTTGNMRVSGAKNYNAGGTNSFEYFGSSPQVTGFGLPASFTGTLKINNTAGIGTPGVFLSQYTTVGGVLDLTSGKLTTSLSTMLNIADNATAINYSDNSFVNGPMTKTGDEDFEFPVGKGNEIHKASLTAGSGTGATDIFRVEYFKGNPGALYGNNLAPGIDHISRLEYWIIDKAAGTGGKKVTLFATTYSDATDLSKLVIARYDGVSTWQNEGNSSFSGLASGPVTSFATVTGFAVQPFTLASTDPSPINPLPINLISFDAVKLDNSRLLLNWELTACCSSAAKFEVQRAGASKNFITVGIIAGSETNRFYNYTDISLTSGINYYRLKMTDADGTVIYSRIAAIMNGVDGLLLTSLIPTVITNSATLTIASSSAQKMDIIIVDMQGRMVKKQSYEASAGNSNVQISTESLPAGAYQLFGIAARRKTKVIRFIKQ